jgi:hypothetical protein
MRDSGFQLIGTQNKSKLLGPLELFLGPAELGAREILHEAKSGRKTDQWRAR